MNKLHLCKTSENNYHGIIYTKHGRYLYIYLSREAESFHIIVCRYVDRARKSIPKKLITRTIPYECLPVVIGSELDRV